MAEVSIVLPVFHPDPEYLVRLFTSIANQTFQDFDLVISDDGDAESMIIGLLPYELEHRTTYYKNHGKKGIFGNLNNAIRNAGGTYLQIFCQDDIMLGDLLAANRKHINDQFLMAFSNFDKVLSNHEVIPHQSTILQYIPSEIVSGQASNYFLYFGCIPGNLSPVMMHKRLLDKAGYFDESYQFAGDYEYWIRASRFTNLYFNKEKHLLVRNHDKSAGKQLGPYKKYEELKPILSDLISRNTIGVSKRALQQYVHIHMFRMLILHAVKRGLQGKRVDLAQLKRIFDGKPFSLSKAFVSFLSPIPPVCRPLQQAMEVLPNQD